MKKQEKFVILTDNESKFINGGLPYCGSAEHNGTSAILNLVIPGLGGLYDLGHLIGSI